MKNSETKKTKKKSKKSKNKDRQQKKWAQLSDDLVVEITSRLYLLSDQVRFRAVCKSWLHAVDEHSNSNNNIVLLPWVIDIKTTHDNIECYIYETSSSNVIKKILFYQLGLHKFDICPCSIKYFPYKSFTAQKFGWIFSCIESRPLSFLLFSPLTKKEIILPRLAYSHDHDCLLITFSTKPDSPDCVFLVLYSGTIFNNTITVNVFCHGFKEWKTQEFDCVEGFYSFQSKIVYIEGIFYFVVPVGQLTSYNVALGEFKVESGFIDNRFTDYMGIYEAFDLNGDLMLIGIHEDGGFIKMFDRSIKAWVPLKSLGNRSIFISYNSIILVPTIEKNGISNYGLLPNKIYCCCTWKYGVYYLENGVYSLESGKLVKFSDESQITNWTKANDLNCWYWFSPADDLLKRKETRNSPVELQVPEETILPVVTDRGVVHSS